VSNLVERFQTRFVPADLGASDGPNHLIAGCHTRNALRTVFETLISVGYLLVALLSYSLLGQFLVLQRQIHGRLGEQEVPYAQHND
jgi:hypothetical protein